MKRTFLVFLFVLILVALVLRVCLLAGNNIFFTVDQGRDAVYVRDILSRGSLFAKGPETNIRGIYNGPLFYYFIALGYLLTSGHPIGGILPIIVLNVALTLFLVLWLRGKVGPVWALFIGASLQLFWPFFVSSLWSFNPFPLVPLSFLLLVLLVKFLKGSSRHYYLALVPITLAFNAEIAGAGALFVFYVLVGLYGAKKNIIKLKKVLLIGILLPLAGAVILGGSFVLQVGGQGLATGGDNAGRVFAGTSLVSTAYEFVNIMGAVILPQHTPFGFLIFVLLAFAFIRRVKAKKEADLLVILSLVLVVVSYVFFASNQGYRGWHTVYLPPLLFVSLMLMLYRFKRIGVVLALTVLAFQFVNFQALYGEYQEPSNNPSLLYNELAAIDWVYESANDQGFKVYNYTDTFYDYPYQYLFWWHGKGKYGYLPDEYVNYPLSPKELYIPGASTYSEPKRSGEYLKFLIVQSDTNGEDNSDWLERFREFHSLENSIQIGGIRVERYRRNHDAPNDPCIWWNDCKL